MDELVYEVILIENYVDEMIMTSRCVKSSMLDDFQRLQEEDAAELTSKGVLFVYTMIATPITSKYSTILMTEVER